jgi:cobalamin biosynthesis protein CobD/CbiB
MAVSEELIKLVARTVFQQMASPYRVALERRLIGAAICGVLALIIAFCLWLVPKLGPALAALVTMAALVIVALILGLAAAAFARRPRTPGLQDIFDSKELSSLVENHLRELLIAAAVGGLIFGMKRRK